MLEVLVVLTRMKLNDIKCKTIAFGFKLSLFLWEEWKTTEEMEAFMKEISWKKGMTILVFYYSG